MEARFEGAKLLAQEDGFWLAVKPLPEDLTRVRRWLREDHKGTQQLTIKQYRKKRSLTANAYAWVLLDKLAEILRQPKEELYREIIRDMGGVSETMAVRVEAIPAWTRAWCVGHMGRMCDDLGPNSNNPAYHDVVCYYGSSDYDMAQMARFIDLLVQECQMQGIETMSDRELSLLKESWNAETNNGT